MPVAARGAVVFNRQINSTCFHLRVDIPEVARDAKPGQFVQVKVGLGIQPLLRTPLSVHDADSCRGMIELLYRVVGESTRLLSQLRPGDQLDVLGPLGRGFSLPATRSEAWLLAGGIGVAPLFYLARILRLNEHHVHLLYGARTEEELVRVSDFLKLGAVVELCTDDGSCGWQGNVVQLAARLEVPKNARIYACGPKPMLRAVDELSTRLCVDAELSLEEYMACGIGACLGCACATRDGRYVYVCTNGPVFPGGVLVYDYS